MKRFLLPFVLLPFLAIGGCTNNTPKSVTEENAQEQFVQTYKVERFKLFPTQNMWTFLKLDTQTGQIWQVQYSLNNNERFEYDLNSNSLVTGKKINGRFELYPTTNIYNLILLDQIDGKLWQVQWAFDEENRGIIPISK